MFVQMLDDFRWEDTEEGIKMGSKMGRMKGVWIDRNDGDAEGGDGEGGGGGLVL